MLLNQFVWAAPLLKSLRSKNTAKMVSGSVREKWRRWPHPTGDPSHLALMSDKIRNRKNCMGQNWINWRGSRPNWQKIKTFFNTQLRSKKSYEEFFSIRHLIVRSQVTAETTTNPAISVNHFLSLSFLIFKLSESFWNCFILILVDQEMI